MTRLFKKGRVYAKQTALWTTQGSAESICAKSPLHLSGRGHSFLTGRCRSNSMQRVWCTSRKLSTGHEHQNEARNYRLPDLLSSSRVCHKVGDRHEAA